MEQDKAIHGDKTQGDKIEGHISNISSGSQVAVGKNIHQSIAHAIPHLTDMEVRQVRRLLSELRSQLISLDIPEDKRLVGEEFAKQLEEELTERSGHPDGSIIKVAGDWLLKHIPALSGALATVFLNPIVGKMVAAAGDVAAEWVQGQFGDMGGQ